MTVATLPRGTLPHRFQPRAYQLRALTAFDRGVKRLVTVWHRRGGKDTTALNACVKYGFVHPGTYYHVLPTLNQGRKVIWDGKIVDFEGQSMGYLDYFPSGPGGLVLDKNEAEMQVTYRTADGGESIYQIVGAETQKDADRLRGTNPRGVILSEYAVQNPATWNVLRPILAENGGWAWFPYTPNGKNHGWKLWLGAQRDPERWFAELLTVEHTRRPDGRPVITPEAIEDERRDGMPEELIQQEFYCSFEAGLVGSYYGALISQARAERRIKFIPYEPSLPVLVGWDIGRRDATALWFVQTAGREVRWIDYYEKSGEVLDHYIKVLKEKPYVYGEFALPHDIKVGEYLTPETRKEKLEAAFPQTTLTVVPNVSVQEGIDQLRTVLPRSVFDAGKCDPDPSEQPSGLNALSAYRKRWDAERKVFLDEPLHDWSSHGADAARILALALTSARGAEPTRRPAIGEVDFNVLTYDHEAMRLPAGGETDFDPMRGPW